MIRTITLYGDPVLRRQCDPIEEITADIRKLADDMIETMREADGVGLAAPQVGVGLSIAVVELAPEEESVTRVELDGQAVSIAALCPLILINPELELGDSRDLMVEGCLSIPEVRASVRRPFVATVRYQGLDGASHTLTSDGLLARAIQHEVDHLNGVLFLDRLSTAAKMSAKRQLKRVMPTW